jgi:hypothetical protein
MGTDKTDPLKQNPSLPLIRAGRAIRGQNSSKSSSCISATLSLWKKSLSTGMRKKLNREARQRTKVRMISKNHSR